MRIGHCRKCGSEVVKIKLGDGRVAVCDVEEKHYWLKHPTVTVVTPNGEEIFASLQGELKDACGIGRTVHICGGGKK